MTQPLLDRIIAAEARAKEAGAIVGIISQRVAVDDPLLPFVASWVSSMEIKDKAALTPPASGNPFLPYEALMYIADLDAEHVLLICKFQMEPHHVLVVTRAAQPQQQIVSRGDMAAVCRLLGEIDGYMMFNGGKTAGASQDHRHLHIVPTNRLPLDAAFAAAAPGVGRFAPFGFAHALVRFADGDYADVGAVHALLRAALAASGIDPDQTGASPAYNLLMTRRWLLVVPRSHEHFAAEGAQISVNALHYGGAVGVRTPDLLPLVQRTGLAAILSACAPAG